MNTKDDQPNTVQEQAARYVARLYSGEMTAADEDDLFSWLRLDPAHRRAYDEVLALWDAAGEIPGKADLAAAPSSGLRNWRKSTAWLAAAAVVVAVVGIPALQSGLFGGSEQGRRAFVYETDVGDRRNVTMADGSRLTLNTGSRVLVNLEPDRRSIILEFGEVFFDIEEDPDRMLTVRARGHVVSVLGTQFNVMVDGNEVRVAVVEGVVAVSGEETFYPVAATRDRLRVAAESGTGSAPTPGEQSGMDDVILRAGTTATFGAEYQQVVEDDTDAMERIQSWREGVVRFDGEPLYRVIAELNRYSQVKILVEDATIMNLPVSGLFRVERVDLILSAIEEIVPVEVVRHSDRYVLVGADPGRGLRVPDRVDHSRDQVP
ncbi:MAG: FecR domain-containing protein [Gammaproteobacteria bacterium]|nr:FecR domain-containing protein [Gammaproteobacteria bacterium]